MDRWIARVPRTGSTGTSTRGCPTIQTSRALFSENDVYRYHPYDEPIVGREAVLASWLGEGVSEDASTRDVPGTYEAEYSPVAIDGDAAVATGTSRYREVPGGPSSAPTKTASSCGSTAKDAAATALSTTSASP